MPSVSQSLNVKACETCGGHLVVRNTRDLTRKRFCSKPCRYTAQRQKRAFEAFREARVCAECGIDYIATQPRNLYCSRRCLTRVMSRRHVGRRATLENHIRRLIVRDGRRHMTVEQILALYHRQGGKCALTGVDLTWDVNAGNVRTNLSIDRITSTRGYELDNLQLVCRITNVMKTNLEVGTFRDWCRRVVDHADAE